MTSPQPLISVITTCLNAAPYLEEAIQSVSQQDYKNFEHIVCDGGSTDGSLEILSRHPHLKADIRPDQGIYDGMNRGLSAARGDIICILNADDFLKPGALSLAANTFSLIQSLAMLTGGAEVVSENPSRETIILKPSAPPSFVGIAFGSPVVNARFYSKSLLEQVGLFDLSFSFAADREWLFRIVASGLKMEMTDETLYGYRAHEGSASMSGTDATAFKLWHEHLKLTDTLILSDGTPPALKSVCYNWRAIERTKLALRTRRTDPSKSRSQLLFDLVTRDPLYLIHLTMGLMSWLSRRRGHSDQ